MKSIKTHLKYLESNHIELVVLLCEKLFDEERLGITYKEIKQATRLMDVIELARKKDDEDLAENYNHHDPVGYDELLQVLQNFLWSNVNIKGGNVNYSQHKQLKDEHFLFTASNTIEEPVSSNPSNSMEAGPPNLVQKSNEEKLCM